MTWALWCVVCFCGFLLNSVIGYKWFLNFNMMDGGGVVSKSLFQRIWLIRCLGKRFTQGFSELHMSQEMAKTSARGRHELPKGRRGSWVEVRFVLRVGLWIWWWRLTWLAPWNWCLKFGFVALRISSGQEPFKDLFWTWHGTTKKQHFRCVQKL